MKLKFFAKKFQIAFFTFLLILVQTAFSKPVRLAVHWYESKPFIYKNKEGKMDGIEADILYTFQKYYNLRHKDTLVLVWKEASSFGDIIPTVSKSKYNQSVGISAFSITEYRKRIVDFTESYIADISVLITSKDVPIARNVAEFDSIFSKLKAITIKGTTYEHDLQNLKLARNINFETEYIGSDKNVLKTLEKCTQSFGFIDLPIYLMYFYQNTEIKVVRQNLFPIKRLGYAFAMPKNSDFKPEIDSFLLSPAFKKQVKSIIGKYFDVDIYNLIESLTYQQNEEVVLLSKEKEIQQKSISEKTQIILAREQLLIIVCVLLAVILIAIVVIVYLYRNVKKDHQLVSVQKVEIEKQKDELESKNKTLIELDQEKNHLINILAHDLRTPINHIQGMAQILLFSSEKEGKQPDPMLKMILNTSKRVGKMISNILDIDSLENHQSKLVFEKINVCDVLNEIKSSFEEQSLKKNISIYLLVKEDFNVDLFTDQVYFTEIFENLISNALKFSPKESKVEIEINQKSDRLYIAVKDLGPGMTEEDLLKLFTKYSKLSAQPTGGEKSIGLGLSIVKKYADMLGAEVWCESEFGKGAVFTVSFQLSRMV